MTSVGDSEKKTARAKRFLQQTCCLNFACENANELSCGEELGKQACLNRVLGRCTNREEVEPQEANMPP